MYLRELHIENLKLLKDIHLSFEDGEGNPRMWTVLIGENGTGKSSILHAIALAAAGAREINGLSARILPTLRDRRSARPLGVQARFLVPPPIRDIFSVFSLHQDENSLDADIVNGPEGRIIGEIDPLVEARSRGTSGWFTAGYGVSRVFPEGEVPPFRNASIERMESLFKPVQMMSLKFVDIFPTDRVKLFVKTLKQVLIGKKSRLLAPGLQGIEIGGRGGVRRASDLLERDRFAHRTGQTSVKVPAVALSHGYQSTIAWIADLIGHLILDAGEDVPSLDEMQGLVLIDEIDLHLHPTWQAGLIPSLREVFPKIQFIVTTHSPLVIAGLHPEKDQIIHLRPDIETGDIVPTTGGQDPRLLSGSELYQQYFDLKDPLVDEAGRMMREYRYLAANPWRSDEDHREMLALRRSLRSKGLDPSFEPVPRRAPDEG